MVLTTGPCRSVIGAEVDGFLGLVSVPLVAVVAAIITRPIDESYELEGISEKKKSERERPSGSQAEG